MEYNSYTMYEQRVELSTVGIHTWWVNYPYPAEHILSGIPYPSLHPGGKQVTESTQSSFQWLCHWMVTLNWRQALQKTLECSLRITCLSWNKAWQHEASINMKKIQWPNFHHTHTPDINKMHNVLWTTANYFYISLDSKEGRAGGQGKGVGRGFQLQQKNSSSCKGFN